MPAFNPLPFQKTAIDDLNEAFLRLWKKQDRQLPLVFKSPTGSGKTLTIAHFIRGLNHLPQWKIDKTFVWITFSDDLAMQSKVKFKEYFENNLENTLLTVNDINRGKLYENDILFLNWQKVVQDNTTTRKLKLRKPKDERFKKESGSYFEDMLTETKKAGREIILFVDEAHTHKSTELAQEIIDFIDPKIIVHITATPDEKDELAARRLKGFVEVDRERVVDEGLIKERVLVQTEEDLKKFKSKDLDEVLLTLGMERRQELANEFKALDKDINPLMLIQLPNDDKELVATKEEVVSQFLASRGIKNKQIAKWFDNKKENLDFISDNDSKVDYMLFKQAAGTGWDCPRASVLVMFREIKKETFYTQTVGRILRMAEPQAKEDYKNNPNLRTGYLYTNYKRSQVELPDIKKNEIPSQHAYRRQGIKNVKLQSAYISRIDYGDIPASSKFQESFMNSMNAHFGIIKAGLQTISKTEAWLKKAGVDLNHKLTNSIIANAKFEDLDQIAYEFKKRGVDVELEMSTNDVEKTFNYFCLMLLKEQTDEQAKYTNVARAWGVFKSAIRVWFHSVLSKDSNYYYRVFVKDIQKGAGSKFRPAITRALIDFKPIAQTILKEKKEKEEENEAPVFKISEQYDFTADYEEVSQKLCVLDKCFVLKDYKGKNNELNFIEYLESKDKQIEWWFKNGNQGKEYFAIKYFNNVDSKEALFYPDFIIRFKNGKIGIFDPKKDQTAEDPETADKAKALSLKLKELGKGYVGGIAVFENGVWNYNGSEKYNYKKGKMSQDKNWLFIEKLF
ncbi:MAG: DEAD/DEAH box helicase family protein [Candidatus Wildermuthbacteria bacterium]|nr:DEAD/DEAH box helicase family protein [Candidatus Wildermuthbacteria bacterium]